MKANFSIDPDMLKRDWILGVSGDVFRKHVQGYVDKIKVVGAEAFARGVLIAAPEPVQFAAAFFAAVFSGVPPILANPNWRRLEWEQVGQQVQPSLVFGGVSVPGSSGANAKGLQPGAILIPTGGSSGAIKFTIHNWETLTAAFRGFQSFMGPGPIHSCCTLPLCHVSGLMQVVRSFVSGGQIAFCDFKALQAGHFPSFSTGLSCLSLVPTQLQRMLGQAIIVDWLKTLSAIFLGGGPMLVTLQERIRELRLPVVLVYGMTETAAMVTALPSDEFLSGTTSAGRPLEHAEVEIVREDGSICSTNEPGLIRIRARSLCLGYQGGGHSGFSEKGFLSSDEGFLDSRGWLHVIGRSDRIIISGGEKIEPREVEQAIVETGAAKEVLAIGWPDSEWGQRLVAFYVPADKATGVEDWEPQLRTKLANYKIPKQIIPVSKLPLNAQGKPDRVLIEKQLANPTYGND